MASGFRDLGVSLGSRDCGFEGTGTVQGLGI